MIGSLTRRQRRPLWGWLTFLLLLAITASLFLAMRAKTEALDAASTDARLTAQTELATLLEPSDLLAPVAGERALELGTDIEAQITSVSPIDEIRIYSSLGRILYADDPEIVGTRPSYLRDLTFAVASGEAETQVRGGVLQTLVPILLTPGGTVVVAEMSQPAGPIVSSATATWYWIALACGVLLLGTVAMVVLSSQATTRTMPVQVVPAAGHARAPVHREPALPAAPQVDIREIETPRRAADQRAEAAEQNLRAIQKQLKEALDRNAALEARLVAADSTTHRSDLEVASLRERLSETTERLNAAELDAKALRERLSLRTQELEEAQGKLASVRATTEAVAELTQRLETAEGRAGELEELRARLETAERRADVSKAFGSDAIDAGSPGSRSESSATLDGETLEPTTFEPDTFEAPTFGSGALDPDPPEPEPEADPEPFDPTTIAAADRRADEAGLVSRVSAAGFQVSQALDGLEQVNGLLRAAEELAKDADARRREAEASLEEVESRRKELSEVLAMLRSEADEAGRRAAAEAERANAAEERLQQALARAFALEARLDDTGAEPVVKGPRQLTVIVDDRREELREAVATEIRRPLTSIMGLTLAMKHADPSSSKGTHMIRQLGASARRLERLVVQMIDLDGIANGSFVPNTRRVDLRAIVRRVVEETPDIAGLDVHVHAEHAAVETDPALTEQMVEILLANAARRSAPRNPVWVQVSTDRAGAIIAVDDTCEEIPAGLQVRASASDPDGSIAGRKRPKGSTGLALLSRLAELHGGKAWVEQRSGGGASFRVFLPSASQEPHPGTPDASAIAQGLEHDHEDVVVDATSVGSSSFGSPPVTSPSVTDRLRELSSFDDLTDELAI